MRSMHSVSKESVYSGAYDDFVAKNFQESEKYHTKIDNIFLEQINSWRLEIGRYLYSNNVRYHDERVLNDVVQEFINQIIFYVYVKIENSRCTRNYMK